MALLNNFFSHLILGLYQLYILYNNLIFFD
ncbi:MAG: hypothetical protein KatS3mg129_2343 [Leptospiraceae bacterium]|nr:MAG: hypothetical protein KatS3mg129_2343 [Leptospiraceae bacterium]